jgi:hypothetical protein
MLEMLKEIEAAIPEMKWREGPPVADLPNARHYIGDYGDWTLQLMTYGETVDGAGANMSRCVVLHLTPDLASKARDRVRAVLG